MPRASYGKLRIFIMIIILELGWLYIVAFSLILIVACNSYWCVFPNWPLPLVTMECGTGFWLAVYTRACPVGGAIVSLWFLIGYEYVGGASVGIIVYCWQLGNVLSLKIHRRCMHIINILLAYLWVLYPLYDCFYWRFLLPYKLKALTYCYIFIVVPTGRLQQTVPIVMKVSKSQDRFAGSAVGMTASGAYLVVMTGCLVKLFPVIQRMCRICCLSGLSLKMLLNYIFPLHLRKLWYGS
jgi:hypothetical protein